MDGFPKPGRARSGRVGERNPELFPRLRWRVRSSMPCQRGYAARLWSRGPLMSLRGEKSARRLYVSGGPRLESQVRSTHRAQHITLQAFVDVFKFLHDFFARRLEMRARQRGHTDPYAGARCVVAATVTGNSTRGRQRRLVSGRAPWRGERPGGLPTACVPVTRLGEPHWGNRSKLDVWPAPRRERRRKPDCCKCL